MMNKLGRLASATALAAALASCGGGGGSGGTTQNGGGSTNSGSTNNPAGAWLSFSPATVDMDVFSNMSTWFSVTATSAKTISDPINVAIIDSKGVITAKGTTVTAQSSLRYSASMNTDPALAPGVHTGSFEVRLCYDTPLTCARPVDGSPWQLPYTIRVIDPAAQSYQSWEVAQTTPGFLDNFALSYQSGKPIVVTAGFYTHVMETWTSADIGSTWTKVTTPAAPAPLARSFALASDDTAVYLSGGQGLPTSGPATPNGQYASGVWKFDCANWKLRTATAAYAGRENHVMVKVGASLFVAGGSNAGGILRDLWRSNDDGATWSKVVDTLPAALGNPTCGLNWQGSLLLAGDAVATSPDGVNWTVHGGYPAGFPKGSVQCAVMGGRLFLVAPLFHTDFMAAGAGNDGMHGSTVSSADLRAWKAERAPGQNLNNSAPGMAAVSGRLVVSGGQGTSQRTVFRTVP
ncbi:hypothetical protein [Roseateles sp.]|uniref:hypothetical protein n=1 Tax=Roseateles sp. TaxID=1971397 RepID=UPI00326789F9